MLNIRLLLQKVLPRDNVILLGAAFVNGNKKRIKAVKVGDNAFKTFLKVFTTIIDC